MPITSVEALIRENEGTGPVIHGRFRVYDDATGAPIVSGSKVIGHATIGVGRNLAGRGLSHDEVDVLLEHDILASVAHAEKYPFFVHLNAPRKAAIVDLMFNIGPTRFKKFIKMIAALHRGDYSRAAIEMLDSRYAEQVKFRARRNAEMLHSGTWPAG